MPITFLKIGLSEKFKKHMKGNKIPCLGKYKSYTRNCGFILKKYKYVRKMSKSRDIPLLSIVAISKTNLPGETKAGIYSNLFMNAFKSILTEQDTLCNYYFAKWNHFGMKCTCIQMKCTCCPMYMCTHFTG